MASSSRRTVAAGLLLLAALAAAPKARAGDPCNTLVVAMSADGHYAAVVSIYPRPELVGELVDARQDLRYGSLGKPLLTARCCDVVTVLPFSRWVWERRTPEVRALHAFADPRDDGSAGKLVRTLRDQDTGLLHLEILQGGRWWAVMPLPDGGDVTGTLALDDRYLVRLHETDGNLFDWAVPLVFEKSKVADVGARWLHERGQAALATGALRDLRAAGERPFTAKPHGRRNRDQWDYRRAHALDPVILRWESAAAYGPLTPQDLLDLVWLLAMRAAPGYRLEALRVVRSLKERDPRAAEALMATLERDPDTAALVPLLRDARDPLRHLPEPRRAVLSKKELEALSDEELHWLHRELWAQGGFRFADPSVANYFALFGWYAPMRERDWQRLLADPFFLRNPDKSVLVYHDDSLRALLEVEQERGLAPPALK